MTVNLIQENLPINLDGINDDVQVIQLEVLYKDRHIVHLKMIIAKRKMTAQ